MDDDHMDSPGGYEKGCELTHAGKLSEAVAIFTRNIDSKHRQAESYFRRGVCHYKLGNIRMAEADMNAASLLGCVDSQMWSRYDIQNIQNSNPL